MERWCSWPPEQSLKECVGMLPLLHQNEQNEKAAWVGAVQERQSCSKWSKDTRLTGVVFVFIIWSVCKIYFVHEQCTEFMQQHAIIITLSSTGALKYLCLSDIHQLDVALSVCWC